MAVIDAALPSQVADTAPGRTPQLVRFTGYEPIAGGSGLEEHRAHIRDTVRGNPGAPAQLLAGISRG